MKITPRLDELIKSLEPLVERRGAKASLARHIGMPWHSVWMYIKGTRKPSGEVCMAIQEWIKMEVAGLNPK